MSSTTPSRHPLCTCTFANLPAEAVAWTPPRTGPQEAEAVDLPSPTTSITHHDQIAELTRDFEAVIADITADAEAAQAIALAHALEKAGDDSAAAHAIHLKATMREAADAHAQELIRAVEQAKRETAAAAKKGILLLTARLVRVQIKANNSIAAKVADVDKAVALTQKASNETAEAVLKMWDELDEAWRKAEAENAEAVRAVEAGAALRQREAVATAKREAEDAKAIALVQAADEAAKAQEDAVNDAIKATRSAGIQCITCLDAQACQMPFTCRHVLVCYGEAMVGELMADCALNVIHHSGCCPWCQCAQKLP